MQPQRVWFLHRFGLKTDTDFDHFDLESVMAFEGTTGMYESIPKESERKTNMQMLLFQLV